MDVEKTNAVVLEAMLKLVDEDLDIVVATAKESGASPTDVAFLDRVLRPYAKLMEESRRNDIGSDDFLNSTLWGLSVVFSECVLNVSDRQQPDQVYAKANHAMQVFGTTVELMLTETLQVPRQH